MEMEFCCGMMLLLGFYFYIVDYSGAETGDFVEDGFLVERDEGFLRQSQSGGGVHCLRWILGEGGSSSQG